MKPFEKHNSKFGEPDTFGYQDETPPEEVAESRGLVCVFPKPNQLQIDLDSDAAYDEFNRRLNHYQKIGSMFLTHLINKSVTISASGLPNRHVTLSFEESVQFDDMHRLAYQAALGDDPLRVFLGAARIMRNVQTPFTLFEKEGENGKPLYEDGSIKYTSIDKADLIELF
jgi:hypothetical protein